MDDVFNGTIHFDPDQAPDEGLHNQHFRELFDHWIKGKSYRDRSTIMAVPAISNPACEDKIIPVPPRVAQSWLCLQTPANQKFTRIMVENCEVADAYNQIVQLILSDDELRNWQYLLTVETDNIPPPYGLLQLLDDMESTCHACGHPAVRHENQACCTCDQFEAADYAAIGGLYWVKGPGGSPMCYGKTNEIPRSYRPWVPPPDAVTECNGLGMGFTLFKIDMFKQMPAPWFRTVQEWVPGIGERQQTQDMYFFNNAGKAGFRCACSTNVRVGHIDSNGIVW